jgi:hypothetical protein
LRFPKSNYRVTIITMDRLFLSIFPEGEVFRFGEEVKHVLEGLGGGGQDSIRKVHVISAAKGMGKSKAIRKTVGTAATAALNITFRRSLARSSSADIPGCLVYMDHDDLDEAMTAGKPMTVLINSLLRISPSVHASPKVIVLDEWVSILEMLGSELIDDQKRYQIIKRLHQLLQFAETIIVSDALLDCDSLVCLRAFLESGAGAGLRETAGVAGAAGLGKVAYDIALYDYAHKPHAFHEFIHHAKLEEWMARLVDSVLGCNRKVVIPCMTKAFALRMYEMVKDWGRQVLLYTSDSCADMLATSLSNINDAWAGCDILIYSPVITAGCSFEIRSHFDECFLYAYQGTASVRSALQMMFRVRDLSHLKVHIHLEKGSMADFTQVHDLVAIHPRSSSGLGALIDDASAYPLVINDHIMRLRKVRELDRRFCFGSAFWDLLKRSGARIVGDPLASEKCVQESTTIAVRQAREDLTKVPVRRSRIHLGDLIDEGIIDQENIHIQFTHVPPPDPFFDSQANEFDPERWFAFMYALYAVHSGGSMPASAVVVDASMAKLANKVRDKIVGTQYSVPPNLVFESLSPRLWPLSVDTGSMPSVDTGSMPSVTTSTGSTCSTAVLFRIPFYECDNLYAQLAESILGTIFCLAIGWNGSLDGKPITLAITIENVVCRKLVSASIRVANPYKALSVFISAGKLRRPMNNYERVQRMVRMVSAGQGIASESLRHCFVRHINVWARAKLQNRGIERIEDKDLVAIEPMDPTISGNWEDPMSMALALSIGTHALVHLKITTALESRPPAIHRFSLLVPCDPLMLSLAPDFHPTEKPEC